MWLSPSNFFPPFYRPLLASRAVQRLQIPYRNLSIQSWDPHEGDHMVFAFWVSVTALNIFSSPLNWWNILIIGQAWSSKRSLSLSPPDHTLALIYLLYSGFFSSLPCLLHASLFVCAFATGSDVAWADLWLAVQLRLACSSWSSCLFIFFCMLFFWAISSRNKRKNIWWDSRLFVYLKMSLFSHSIDGLAGNTILVRIPLPSELWRWQRFCLFCAAWLLSFPRCLGFISFTYDASVLC